MDSENPPGPPPGPPDDLGIGPHPAHDHLAWLDATRLSAFFECVPATVWMTDERMVLTFVQGPLLRRLKVDPTRLIGRTLADILLDRREDHPLIQGHLSALSGHESVVRVEWGGDLYSTRIGPLRDRSGRIAGCVGIQQQIGWLPEVDETLRKNDVRLRRVIESNLIGIAFGDEEGRITDANDTFLQLTGYARADLAADGISWPALTAVEYHQRELHALSELQDRGRCTPFEVELIRKDGRRVSVLVGAARMSATRREGVAFVLDVTDRKRVVRRLQSELAAADLLAEAAGIDDAVAPLIRILRDDLAWKSFAWWSASPEGALQLFRRVGTPEGSGGETTIDSVARRAVSSGHAMWLQESEVFAAPLLAAGRCYGVIVLAGRPPEAPDTELVQTCWRITQRLAKFIARQT